MVNKLTDTQCKAFTAPGDYGDSACTGLILRVAKGGSRAWVFRAVFGGKRRKLGLGAYPKTSLKQARAKAAANRALLDAGLSPLGEDRRARDVPTFRTVAERVHELRAASWKSDAHGSEWMGSLERHCFPVLGDMPIDRIQTADILATLEPIWQEVPETARRIRNRISKIMDWAISHGFRSNNPAGRSLDGALPYQKRPPVHHRALGYRGMAESMAAIAASDSTPMARLALRFTILTACRSGEVRMASWSEIDLDAQIWTIPESRMKGGLEHRVPLSPAAIAVLQEAMPHRIENGLCFPSPKTGRALSPITLQAPLKAAGLHAVASVHGFRSTFRDWAVECTSSAWAVMEQSLAHAVGGSVERAYARSDLLQKRRALMTAWAEFCTAPAESKVIQFPIAATG